MLDTRIAQGKDNPPVIEERFQIGSTVHLKSGSPDLTIVGYSGDDLLCVWNSADGEGRDTFPRHCVC